MRGIRVQPGGNKVTFFNVNSNADEVYRLENFLGALTAKK